MLALVCLDSNALLLQAKVQGTTVIIHERVVDTR